MGLLGDIYSFGNRAKRAAKGLLSDPIGTVQQSVGELTDNIKEYNRLNKIAWESKDPVAQRQAEDQVNQMSLNGLLNFAPIGMTAKVGAGVTAPRAKAMRIAQQNAAKPVSEGGLGLRPDNTPMERAKAMGFEDYYHGTERLDRLLEKKALDPKRATSGPMPFGTDSTEIASNYAASKADTSRIANDSGEIRNYFQVSPKQLGTRGTAPYSVEQSWYLLPSEVKQDILNKYKRVGYENIDQASGPFTLHPEGIDASLSSSHMDWLMKTEARGNPLTALRAMWHDGGDLVGAESSLADIYKLAGYPHEISQSNAPWFKANGVLTGKVAMKNPLDTANSAAIDSLIPKLEQAFKGDRTRAKLMESGADPWDKTTRFTPKSWVEQLKSDVAEGNNSYVWTSIPDKVTDQLKSFGYDGILDAGGKGGGYGHQVKIPFYPEQVRSRFAAFDPARRHEADLLGQVTPEFLPYVMGAGLLGAYGMSEK